jgi:hypothetical protein
LFDCHPGVFTVQKESWGLKQQQSTNATSKESSDSVGNQTHNFSIMKLMLYHCTIVFSMTENRAGNQLLTVEAEEMISCVYVKSNYKQQS